MFKVKTGADPFFILAGNEYIYYIQYIYKSLISNKNMTYTRVKDLEKIVDRDRNTILRWEREGRIPRARKDSRGWRFYTEEDISQIKSYLSRNNPYYSC